MTVEEIAKCWICDGDANSGEHRHNKSDIRAVFDPVDQKNPLYYHDNRRANLRLQSIDSKHLRFPDRICHECNTKRTQPHDQAWHTLREALLNRGPTSKHIFRANGVFPYDTRRQMLNVHLFFLKKFGCRIMEAKVDYIDTSSFSASIRDSRAHPDVYLKFGFVPIAAGIIATDFAGQQSPDRSLQFIGWYYLVDTLCVGVFYAKGPRSARPFDGCWHPKFGTTKLLLEDFHNVQNPGSEVVDIS